MRMTIDQFKEFADDSKIGFNDRIKVNVLSTGRVPFINVGPQFGVHLQRFEVEGLITMGYNVEIITSPVHVQPVAVVEHIEVNAVVVTEQPLVQEVLTDSVELEVETKPEEVLENKPEEDSVSETDGELILQMDAKWLKDNLSVDELKVILETIQVTFNKKALENELANLVVKNEVKVKEHFKVA